MDNNKLFKYYQTEQLLIPVLIQQHVSASQVIISLTENTSVWGTVSLYIK